MKGRLHELRRRRSIRNRNTVRTADPTGLDGSQPEDVIASIQVPVGIALDVRAPGDLDDNNRVDLRDFARFQTCFRGETSTFAGAPCTFFDFDAADRDVDLADFAHFQQVNEGP